MSWSSFQYKFCSIAVLVVVAFSALSQPCVSTEKLALLPSREVLCEGNPVVLSNSSALKVTWLDPEVKEGVAFRPKRQGYYVAKAIDEKGCEVIDSVEIIINPAPEITLRVSEDFVCTGEGITLHPEGGQIYLWNKNVVEEKEFFPEETAEYIVTGSDDKGCSNTASVTVEVEKTPELEILTSKSSVCLGDMVKITATAPLAKKIVFSGGVVNGTPFAPQRTTTYAVTAINNGCVASKTIPITVIASPEINLGGDREVCNGSNVVLDATTPEGSYKWTSGETTPVVIRYITQTENIGVTVTTKEGCVAEKSVTIKLKTCN